MPDGAVIATRSAGPVDAPPILLLQGQNNSMRWWDRVRTGFEDSHRTVTFDYRGTGATRSEPGEWSTRSFAEDAAHVMAELGHDRYAVVGASMGGMIAQHLAADHPDRVTRLVLVATSPGGPLAAARDGSIRSLLASPNHPDRTEAVLRLFYTDEWPGTTADTTLLGAPGMTADAARAHLRVSRRHDAWRRLPDIQCPVLILHGTHDRLVPVENAELMASAIVDARVWLHDGGRHGFFDEFADEVTPRILDFLG